MEALKFAPGTDDVVEGWGIPFGGPFNGRDLDNEAFTKSTDLCLDWYPSRPAIYHHGLDEDAGTSVVGRVKQWEMKDQGLWVQAQLDRSSDYFSAIKELIQAGKLFFSSGAMPHLVQKNVKSGEITRWPWVELSFTPSPANLYATVDFATAEKHFKSAGLDVDALKAKMTAEERDALPDSDFAYIDSDGTRHLPINDAAHVRDALARFDQTTFESEDAKAAAKKKILARAKELGVEVAETDDAKKSASVKSMEGSYEDLIDDLSDALNPITPFGGDAYSCIVATFPAYVIVHRYEYGEDDDTYWRVAYTIGDDGEPVLGTAEQVEQTYVPAKSAAPLSPLTLEAQSVSRRAQALAASTKGLHERRIAEGRVLSAANRVQIAAAVTALGDTGTALQTLLDATAQMERAQAKAAALASPDGVQRRLAALSLVVDTLPE